MTRVNLVHVQDLADQHLFAEWRELKMVPSALRRSLSAQSLQKVLSNVPCMYTMSTGHVAFFYNKMRFLHQRYLDLTNELYIRNYNIAEHDANSIFFDDIPIECKTIEWSPTSHEISTNVSRIVLRLNQRADWYRYYGKITPPEYFEALYKLQLTSLQSPSTM